MLKTHSADAKAFWIDLLNPTSDEIARVAAEYGIDVPSRESLQEIETSSRLRADGQVLYASMPLAIQDQAAGFAPVPLGFILSPAIVGHRTLFGGSRFCASRGRRSKKAYHVGSAARLPRTD